MIEIAFLLQNSLKHGKIKSLKYQTTQTFWQNYLLLYYFSMADNNICDSQACNNLAVRTFQLEQPFQNEIYNFSSSFFSHFLLLQTPLLKWNIHSSYMTSNTSFKIFDVTFVYDVSNMVWLINVIFHSLPVFREKFV